MITKVHSFAFNGVDVVDVDVEVKIEPGIPKFTIVGLADKTIAESKERVRASLSSVGLSLPAKKILINLAPADLIKEGSHFDLAIAVGILASMNALPKDELEKYIVLGELSLDGNILPVSGVLPAAMGANARNKGIMCSVKNGSEAAWSGVDEILAPNNLLELINHFNGNQLLTKPEINLRNEEENYPDLSEVKGQRVAKRALEIAAAGGHNLLMFGPPGSGKSMLAERLAGILPELTAEEILEISAVNSIAGMLQDGSLSRKRPYRAPHHTCTSAAMVGGGSGRKVRPGEISLAHKGVLFLDELPEFPPGVIEALRQPLETSQILISRSGNYIRYPSEFQLIAAMNPCKCGYLSDPYKSCSRAPACASNYQSKVSGPILDRFDLHIEVANESNYDYSDFYSESKEESSKEIKDRVMKAKMIQYERYEGYKITQNSKLDGQLLIDYAIPIDEGKDILNEAAKKFRLSMRAYNRVLRVARTIADIGGEKWVNKIHIAEALSYRQMDAKSMVNA